jgi:hypothetical protein
MGEPSIRELDFAQQEGRAQEHSATRVDGAPLNHCVCTQGQQHEVVNHQWG